MPSGYEALRSGAAWLDLSARGKLYAMGDDRARLLHAICTNHIQELEPGEGRYAFFLNAQGRILADANILCMKDRFLLDTEPETRHSLLAHIDKYIIADDVTLEDVTEALATVAVEGPDSREIMYRLGLPEPAADGAHMAWGNGGVAQLSFTGAPAFRVFLPKEERDSFIARLEGAGVVHAGEEAARIVRLEHARPRYGEDIGETTLPQETQLKQALHFNKGCYLGQEIVERIRSRGHVNRLLQGLWIEGNEPLRSGTPLTAEGAAAGEITSAAFSPALGKVVALGYVRALNAKPGTRLAVADSAVEVRPLLAGAAEPNPES